MSDYQSGQIIVTSLTGSELVSIDTGGAEVAACTTQLIADLASLSSDNEQITTISTVGAGVLTAAGVIGGIISRTGAQAGAAFSDATDTAVAIIAAMPSGAPVGTTFTLTIANTTDAQETITAGLGVTLTGSVIVPKLTWASFLVKKTAAATVSLTFVASGEIISMPYSKVASQAITVLATLQVGGICGAQISNLLLTGATPASPVSLALPPAAELFAAIPNAAAGLNYLLIIRNIFTTTSVATITGSATGVTLAGLATIAQNVSGMFNISIDSPTAYTATRVGP